MALRKKQKDISQEKQSILRTARGRNGLMSTGMIAIVVAIVILFNLAVGLLPAKVRQFDLSTTKIYEISDTTKEYLANLKEKIHLVVVAEPDKIDSRISRFLDRYTAQSDQITMEAVDPVAYPSALKEYDCEANSIVVQCEGKDQTYTIPFDDILVPDYYSSYYSGGTTYTKFDGDGQLTSAIDAVVSSTSYQIYTLTNHGEASLGTQLTQRLTKSHFKTEELSLLREGKIPDDCKILLINQPTKDLAKDELKLIRTYLKSGGQVSLILPSQDFDHPNLDSLMKEYGLALTGGYAGDTQRYYTAANSYLTFFPELDVGTEVAGSLTTDDLALVNQALAMKQVDAKREYDFILLDCTPSLGMLTVNALAAADTTLIPVQAQYLSAKGLEQLLQTVQKVRRQINPKLKIEGILLTMTDSRTNYGQQIDNLIRGAYGSKIKVFDQTIPRSVRAAEISAVGKSIFQHDPKGKVAEAYKSLTEEVMANAEKQLKRVAERGR